MSVCVCVCVWKLLICCTLSLCLLSLPPSPFLFSSFPPPLLPIACLCVTEALETTWGMCFSSAWLIFIACHTSFVISTMVYHLFLSSLTYLPTFSFHPSTSSAPSHPPLLSLFPVHCPSSPLHSLPHLHCHLPRPTSWDLVASNEANIKCIIENFYCKKL